MNHNIAEIMRELVRVRDAFSPTSVNCSRIDKAIDALAVFSTYTESTHALIAFCNGAKNVQWRWLGQKGEADWRDCQADDWREYRFKPEPKEPLKCRHAQVTTTKRPYTVWNQYEANELAEQSIFVRWLTDWQEVEVPHAK